MNKSFKHFLQPDQMDCGITCLKMVANFHGANYPISYLREFIPSSRLGTNMLSIAKAANDIGFKTLATSGSLEDLTREHLLPAILYWNPSHFIVLFEIKEKKIKEKSVYTFGIADPAFKNHYLSEDLFREKWLSTGESETGLVLFLEPTENIITKFESHKATYVPTSSRFISAYLSNQKWNFIKILLITFGTSLLALVFPILTQKIVDIGIPQKNLSFIFLILLSQIVAFFSSSLFEYFKSKVLFSFTTRINIIMLSNFLSKLTRLSLKYFDGKMSGDITQRVADHIRIERFVSSNLLSMLLSVFTLILYTTLILRYDFLIFTIFFAITTASVLWMVSFIRKRSLLEYRRFEAYSTTSNSVYEIIYGMKELKLNNAQSSRISDWQIDQKAIHSINEESLLLEQKQATGNVLINQIRSSVITFYSAYLVIHHRLTLGEMLSISYMLGLLASPFTQFFDFIKGWNEALFSFERIDDVTSREDEDIEMSPTFEEQHTIVETFSTIKLENVSFKYDLNIPYYTLQNINIEVKQGETLAIVGNSGSVKTTLLKLLLKFYSPTSGNIFIDNAPLTNIESSSWRNLCGAVLQDGYIFSTTIIKNIALDTKKIDIEKVRKVCKLANIDNYIQTLPLKYESKIGGAGNGLSGGQIQRILIARALYNDPDLFLFDEATSSLDTENEKIIMTNIINFCKGKTMIIIAHRLSTVKNADKIIVLDSGKVVELGNHDELYRLKGTYYRLVANQLNFI